MKNDDIKRISWAAKVLNLPERATSKMIKNSYRNMVKIWHPDRCEKEISECENMIKKINEAYKILMQYIKDYKYPLSEEAIRDEEAFLMERFGEDPIWG